MPDDRLHLLPKSFLGSGSRLHYIEDPAGVVCEPHYHLYHEFDYILSGEGIFAVGAREVEVRKGDVVYLARGVFHRRTSDLRRPLVLCNLTIDDETMSRVLDAYPGSKDTEWPWWLHLKANKLDNKESRNILGRLEGLMHQRKDRLRPEDIPPLLPDIARLLSIEPQKCKNGQNIHLLARRVRHNPQKKLDLDTEAEKLGISRWWLSRLFKRQFGVTLWEHRDYARIDLAIKELLASDTRIRDLGLKLGFAGTSQFINTFKRLAGLTPAQFRRHHKR